MNEAKRTVEIFLSECPLCEETLGLVEDAVEECGCELKQHRLGNPDSDARAEELGVSAVPTIAVEGEPVWTGKPTEKQAELLLTRDECC